MAKEIERKFRLQEIPSLAKGAESVSIEQGYLAIDAETEVRVRRADADHVITKGGHGEVRDDFEPPEWLDDEITGDARFAGQSLARDGLPDV